MPFKLPRFYPILDLSVRPERSLEETVRPLVEAGARLIQLRSKQATSREFFEQARKLIDCVPPSVSVIINDRVDVALLCGAAGVHVGQEDLSPVEARKMLGQGKIVGYSTHTAGQLKSSAAEPADYLAFGPVFATTTKVGAGPVVGLEGLRAARKRTSKPLVAIGGITPENAAQVIALEADSVAVISAWQDVDDISARLDEFRRALGSLAGI